MLCARHRSKYQGTSLCACELTQGGDRCCGEDRLGDAPEIPQGRHGFSEEVAFKPEATLSASIRPRCLLCAHCVLGSVWVLDRLWESREGSLLGDVTT